MRRAFFTLLWVATGIVAIVLTLPWFVKNYLAEAGFGAVDFVIEDVSLHHLSLTDIRLGANGEQHIRRLTLAFSLLHLWQNLRADQLTIEGADLRLTVSAEGAVKISGIEPLDIEPENKTPSAPYLPVEWIEVLGSHLVVETPVGEVTVPVDMDLQGTNDEGFTLTAHLLPKHQWVEMDCRINAQISPQGQVEGRLELTNGRLSYQGVDSTGLAGWVTLAGDLTGYRLLNGELSVATLKHAVGQLTDIDLTFQSDGVRYSLLAKAAIPGTPTELRTRAEAGLNAQGISATLTLDLTKADLAQFASLWKPTTGITGQASVHMELFALLPADVASLSDPMDMLQALTTHGRLSLQLDNGAVTGLVEALTAQVDATLALAQSNLSMRTVGDWATTGRLIIAATPLDLRLSNADEAPLNLELALQQEQFTVNGAINVAAQSPDWPEMRGEVQGQITGSPEEPVHFTLDTSGLLREPLVLDNLTIRTDRFEAQFSGTPTDITGHVSLALRAEGTAPGDIHIAGGKANLAAEFSLAEGLLTVSPDDCLTLSVNKLHLPRARLLRPIALCAKPRSDRSFLRASLPDSAEMAFTLPQTPVAMAITLDDEEVKATSKLPILDISATYDEGVGLSTLSAMARGGSLAVPNYEIGFSGIDGFFKLAEGMAARLKIKSVKSTAGTPLFTPFSVEANTEGEWGKKLDIEMNARGIRTPLVFSINGSQDLTSGIGEATFHLDDITFTSRQTPGDLLPPLSNFIKKAQGTIGLRGNVISIEGIHVIDVHLKLDKLSFSAPGLTVNGITTAIETLTAGLPDRGPSQEIRIDLLDIGIPLKNGLIRFNTRSAPAVTFEEIRFTWAGGTLKTEPFQVDLSHLGGDHAIRVKLDEIALDEILDLLPVEGLKGTGTLSGRLPLQINGSKITLQNGILENTGPGVLRYEPKKPPAFLTGTSQTKLLFAALQNFRYDALMIKVNGTTGEESTVTISMYGANPDLYEGYPFKLNFNLTGKLDTIIRRSLSIAQFADKFSGLIYRSIK